MASRSYPAAVAAVRRVLDSALGLGYPIGKYHEVQEENRWRARRGRSGILSAHAHSEAQTLG